MIFFSGDTKDMLVSTIENEVKRETKKNFILKRETSFVNSIGQFSRALSTLGKLSGAIEKKLEIS